MTTRRAPEAPVAAARLAARTRARRHQVPPAFTPGDQPRKEAKALDSGAFVEAAMEKLLTGRKVKVDAWRRPGVRFRRLSGVNYLPDAAGYLPELDGLAVEQTPQVPGRPEFNTLIEFKGQTKTGSAEKKISAAIEDMAHACDALGVAGAVILHTPVLTEQQRAAYKSLGKQHSVVVLEDTELTHDRLVTELVRVAKERRRLMRRIGPRGGYRPTKRPSVQEVGLSYRISLRRTNGKPLRTYGASALLPAPRTAR